VVTHIGGHAQRSVFGTPLVASAAQERREGQSDAIASRVELTAGDLTQRQTVVPTRGYLSQVERTLTFGLGKTVRGDKPVIHWTNGTMRDVAVREISHSTHIRKPETRS
jgi:hypothetical protein